MKANEKNEANRKNVANVIVNFDRVTDEAEIATMKKMHARDDVSEAANEEEAAEYVFNTRSNKTIIERSF